MKKKTGNEGSLIFSYLTLRKFVGLLGTALPLVLSFGAMLLFQTGIRSSISSYYYTGMRDVFVGTLCAIGVFLLSYKGYEGADDIAGNFACLFAVGVALFPTTPDNMASSAARLVGYVHFAFATLFFLTLIYFSLFLFTKTNPKKRPTKQKLQRNKVYRVCGTIMTGCILLALINALLLTEGVTLLQAYRPLYWLESIAIVAFGISWLTKGEAILADES